MSEFREVTIESLGLSNPDRCRTFILTALLMGKEMAGQFNWHDDQAVVWMAKQLFESLSPNNFPLRRAAEKLSRGEGEPEA